MKHRNIVIAPCGNKRQLFNQYWLQDADQKEFDLCILFYHETVEHPEVFQSADYFFHLKDYKYHMLHRLLTELKPEWLDSYDYFYFPDDDIEIDTLQINRMFALSKAMGAAISQASLSNDSFCSWPMFKQKKNSFCRFVGQIEVMAPLFERQALKRCLPSFIGNKSSWGVDSVWPKLLGYPEDRLIVFDCVVMKHTLPVGGGELYSKLGGTPYDEWEHITQQFGAKKHNYREYGRLLLTNKRVNKMQFISIQTSNLLARWQKAWEDFDVNSRIRNQRKVWSRRLGLVSRG